MQEIEYFTCMYYSALFFCSKRSYIKFYTLLNNEDSKKRELQNIATIHSAGIYYKDSKKIYRCTSEPYCFF